MEYLGGGSGLDLLKSGPFDEASIAIICRELLKGLLYLHENGKVNIFGFSRIGKYIQKLTYGDVL